MFPQCYKFIFIQMIISWKRNLKMGSLSNLVLWLLLKRQALLQFPGLQVHFCYIIYLKWSLTWCGCPFSQPCIIHSGLTYWNIFLLWHDFSIFMTVMEFPGIFFLKMWNNSRTKRPVGSIPIQIKIFFDNDSVNNTKEICTCFGAWKHTIKYCFTIPVMVPKREHPCFQLVFTPLSYRNRS